MSRIHAFRPAAFALALGLAASGAALADDSSMSRLTGDSYAYFNNLDYHAGGFNTPRAPQGEQPAGVAKAPVKDKTAKREAADRPAPRLRSIFHDDGGGAYGAASCNRASGAAHGRFARSLTKDAVHVLSTRDRPQCACRYHRARRQLRVRAGHRE